MLRLPPPDASADASFDDRPELAGAIHAIEAMVAEQLEGQRRRLPPERELARTLGVARSTLRHALAHLECHGVLSRHVGRGTFIAAGAQAPPRAIHELSLLGALGIGAGPGISVGELLDARMVLEPGLAELAALHSGWDDHEALRRCLAGREGAARADAYEYWDHQLHRAIALATHNRVLIELLDLVNRLRGTAVWRTFRNESVGADRRLASDQQHRAVVDAICDADPQRAAHAMRIHVQAMLAHYRAVAR